MTIDEWLEELLVEATGAAYKEATHLGLAATVPVLAQALLRARQALVDINGSPEVYTLGAAQDMAYEALADTELEEAMKP